jgi:hypothetical protein
MALTQRELADIGCDTPNCKHDHSQIFFNPRCHPNSHVEAYYDKASGTVIIRCARCTQFVVAVEVAVGGPVH